MIGLLCFRSDKMLVLTNAVSAHAISISCEKEERADIIGRIDRVDVVDWVD
jgi:hypothetical protein